MTKEQKDRICKALTEDRNFYARECENQIAEERGKIEGADYMLITVTKILKSEVEPEESEVHDADCD